MKNNMEQLIAKYKSDLTTMSFDEGLDDYQDYYYQTESGMGKNTDGCYCDEDEVQGAYLEYCTDNGYLSEEV